MKNMWIPTVFLLILSACAVNPAREETTLPTLTATLPPPTEPASVSIQRSTQISDETCNLKPVIAPTLPATIPDTTRLDETTGLHMTGKVQVIDLESYRLKVSGKVDHPLSLGYDDLRCMPKVTVTSELVCPGVFTDHGTWSGVPIKDVLERARVQAGVKSIRMTSADGYEVTISLDMALNSQYFLAYEWEGQPLPILHGFPLRAVFPGQPGGQWLKWLTELVVQ